MNKSTNYADAPEDIEIALKEAKEVYDFLPPPDQLIVREDTRKITIALSKRSVDFFKTAAKQNNLSYQQLIRKVLDNYTEHYAE